VPEEEVEELDPQHGDRQRVLGEIREADCQNLRPSDGLLVVPGADADPVGLAGEARGCAQGGARVAVEGVTASGPPAAERWIRRT
jgi:hypothetical protein